MLPFLRLLAAEGMKLRRAPVARLVWVLPLLFVGLGCLGFERPALGLKAFPPGFQATFAATPARLVASLWAGIFHPLALALLPALVFRTEHRGRTWHHLYAMPRPRWQFFLAKALTVLLLLAAMLGLVALLLLLERKALGLLNPLLDVPFQRRAMFRALAWLWLGSLPVLAIYLWACDRINSMAVPVVFGLLGLLLTIVLSGQELDQPWRRDLNPWILPYAAAEQTAHSGPSQQAPHLAGQMFQPEPNVLRLPSGRKVRTWQNIPDEILFKPPPPTPPALLAAFSSVAGVLLLALGCVTSGRKGR